MQEHEWKFIVGSYSWNVSDTTFHLLQHVENDTYVVHTPNGKYILRRYRQGRYSPDQIRAEHEWMNILGDFIPVPKVVRNTDDDSVSRLAISNEELLYAAFEFVDGQVIEKPTSFDYSNLGRLMRKMHNSTDSVMKRLAPQWRGWHRPKYDLKQTVEEPLRNLLDFGVLSDADRQRCLEIAQELRRRFDAFGSRKQFIHADLHFGNILVTQDKWCCLDFDECGFGHRAIDMGVVRLHLKNKEKSLEYWTDFITAYGDGFSREEISLGTAIRIFYMAGKIPKRQDVEDLRSRPDERIRRYLGWIESEIY
ncbi:phosphotransferase [Alicyclobacillus fastidiosus]|uniref:Phosphotransferase n=1 Tax=Alicyclobacillus fastidiosus TaxID=392011 RepID=A0ABY6ZD27_9BACL|nr:phosphotransferase [Alicyclobacillus fastidiosus]WAH40025.1 phosphotransferase [Alicyclobacillus fastidiosus]GMA61324.1 homoserine kinase [Alicyclobacillus fastidiosus]